MDPAFDSFSFSKNRERLLKHQVALQFFRSVVAEAGRKKLLLEVHFSVDGTPPQAWASMVRIRPKDGDGDPPPIVEVATCR